MMMNRTMRDEYTPNLVIGKPWWYGKASIYKPTRCYAEQEELSMMESTKLEEMSTMEPTEAEYVPEYIIEQRAQKTLDRKYALGTAKERLVKAQETYQAEITAIMSKRWD